jgi:hypothetical protein
MVSPWPFTPFTFRALAKTYGPMWLRCDICRRYARLKLGGLHDIDYRTGVVWALDVGTAVDPDHTSCTFTAPPADPASRRSPRRQFSRP